MALSATALAVLLRQAQWLLADAAHDLPTGRLATQRREELAVILERLAALVRDAGVDDPAELDCAALAADLDAGVTDLGG